MPIVAGGDMNEFLLFKVVIFLGLLLVIATATKLSLLIVSTGT